MTETRDHGTTGVDEVPSAASIVALIVAEMAVFGSTVWVATGETFDGRHLAGFVLGLLASGCLVDQIIRRAHRRVNADREAELAQAKAARYTGSWLDPDTGEVKLTVRFDPDTGRYLALGWIAAGWEAVGEFPFASPRYAFVALAEAERDGLVPAGDRGTRIVRARLCLPGWDMADLDDQYQPV